MNLFTQLQQIQPETGNAIRQLTVNDALLIQLYPNSLIFEENVAYFMGKVEGEKYLWVLSDQSPSGPAEEFSGTVASLADGDGQLLRCSLNHHNATVLRARFEFTRPELLGLDDSFGYGDRLGIANPAHVRAALQSHFKAIFAQQSIRELQRTQRKPEEVMDAATWAVFQEGFRQGFGADADHLKTTADIDLMVAAGYTFFTIDPGEYVVNEADGLPIPALEKEVQTLPWEILNDQPESCISRYAKKRFRISSGFSIQPNSEQILRGLLKYGGVIAHTVKMYRYLKETYPDHPSEVELSVDETESVTSPFEHFLVASELKRLGVQLISLAPRFVGEFEKGIDYKGDIELFKTEYLKHIQIAEKLGPYKISLHSGSDKFGVYAAIGSLRRGHVHVKTAGTSYLEALRTVAAAEPGLFREILDFSRGLYEQEKKTYHVSADLDKIRSAAEYSDPELLALFDENDTRQVLHVTFGKVLTEIDEEGQSLFKDRIMKCLAENEEAHYDFLFKHFMRHLAPFG